MNYNLDIGYTIRDIQGTTYKMIQMDISDIDGKFPIRSNLSFVKVTDGVTEISPFDMGYTTNQKKLYCFFTTDAFLGLSGNVDISFGFLNDVLHTFEAVPINTTINALPSIFSAMATTDADNAWLATV